MSGRIPTMIMHLDHAKYDFSMEQTDLAVQLQPDNQIKVTGNLQLKIMGMRRLKKCI